MKKYIILTIGVFFVLAIEAFGQNTSKKEILEKMQIQKSIYETRENIRLKNNKPCYIKINTDVDRISMKNSKNFLKERLDCSNSYDFKKTSDIDIPTIKNCQLEKYQQYYQGIKIENAQYLVFSKDSIIESARGFFLKNNEFNIFPTISEDTAIEIAKNYIGAKKYAWEDVILEASLKKRKGKDATYYPKGELVVCKNQNVPVSTEDYRLAYKFLICGNIPTSKDYVFVDVHSGEVIRVTPVLKTYTGTAETRYSGTQTISTETISPNYVLRDYSRGDGIETFNLERTDNYPDPTPTDFENLSNYWYAAILHNPNRDDAALDAHWGAMMTYDYFNQIHNRNSFDGQGKLIQNWVHYRIRDQYGVYQPVDIAGWDTDDSVMVYGDGDVVYDAITSLDVVAHELGHGFSQCGPNFDYEAESGALDEGLSDIWGACVEYYALPEKGDDIWLGAEDISLLQDAEKSMINPNDYEFAYYRNGLYWFDLDGCVPVCNPYHPDYNDCCGVHQNSGVIAHWFYLISEGGEDSPTDADWVHGMGIDVAQHIAYATELALLPSDGYYDAFQTSWQVAINMFPDGYCPQVIDVLNAWSAVNVGPPGVPPGTIYPVWEGDLFIDEIDYDALINAFNLNFKTTITNSADIEILYQDEVVLMPDFELELGSTLEIIPCICNCE